MAPLSPGHVDDRVEALEAEIARLRDNIEVLEDALGIGTKVVERFPLEWGLTGKEARVFGVLLKRDMASKLAILAACYTVIDKEPEIKIIDVFVCKIRAKLRPFGISIATQWGQGYFLTSEMKALARSMMTPEPGGAA